MADQRHAPSSEHTRNIMAEKRYLRSRYGWKMCKPCVEGKHNDCASETCLCPCNENSSGVLMAR